MLKDIRRIRAGVAASLMFVLSLVACGGGGSSYTAPNPGATVQVVACPGSEAATVNAVSNSNFSPVSVSITTNQVVKWTNATGFDHTVTSTTGGVPANGTFNAALNSGTSVCLQFTAAGAFNYHCTPHQNMTGLVTVN